MRGQDHKRNEFFQTPFSLHNLIIKGTTKQIFKFSNGKRNKIHRLSVVRGFIIVFILGTTLLLRFHPVTRRERVYNRSKLFSGYGCIHLFTVIPSFGRYYICTLLNNDRLIRILHKKHIGTKALLFVQNVGIVTRTKGTILLLFCLT